MATEELHAFWDLQRLNRLSEWEHFSPERARRGEYTRRLQEAKQPIKHDGN